MNSLNFDKSFVSGRKTKLFGYFPYSYSGITHHPSDFSDNPFILHMFNFISNNLKDFETNSCLINFYPDLNASLPDHSDDEDCIDNLSYIITLSFGSERVMNFKSKKDSNILARVSLRHGSVLIFSKESQDFFTHGFPGKPSQFSSLVDDCIPRVSATFRKLVA